MHVIRICLRVKCLFGMRVEYDVFIFLYVTGLWSEMGECGGGGGTGTVKSKNGMLG